MTKIEVKAIRLSSRKFIQLRWLDENGVPRQKSAKTRRMRDAERLASQLESELNSGSLNDRITFESFIARAKVEHFRTAKYRKKFLAITAKLDIILAPTYLDEVDSAMLAHFLAELREDRELEESTLYSAFSTLRAGLNWARDVGMIENAPKFPRIKQTKKARGRPLTEDEYESMLVAAEKLEYPGLVWTLKVLRTSGLRITECLEMFSWDDPGSMCVSGIDEQFPKIWIPAKLDKNGQEKMIPMAPRCAELLRLVPTDRRTGPVCGVFGKGGKRLATDPTVIRIISRCGRHISTGSKTTATAHDLRRSYGDELARSGIPINVLMAMMRHSNIKTTQQYYLSRDAELNAEQVWRAFKSSRCED